MSWIIVAISAYLMLAITNILDKFLVENVLKSSKAYTFLVCIFSGLAILAAPWFLKWPGVSLFLLDIFTGAVFSLALFFLYESLRRGEASRVLVLIGGITPLFSLIFSFIFLKEEYNQQQLVGFGLLLIGVCAIACLPKERNYLSRILNKIKFNFSSKSGGLWCAFLSAFLYAVYFISSKIAYLDQSFASVFIWSRLGAVLFVLFFLIGKTDRLIIFNSFKKGNPNKNKFLVISNQILGSIGFILQNYAVVFGSVALVNALQGVQYAFILIISTALALLSPKLLKETFSWRNLIQKILAVALIIGGLYFII